MKPPYEIPSMAEIRAVPENGYRVVSTFSGCGGSCLGFRWAGFETVYANEFVPAAAETYHANFPDVELDDRDIRNVDGESIRLRIGDWLGEATVLPFRGEIDVLEGSPPCADFSLVGKRSAGWGSVRKYSDVEQRTDDLFFEYCRLVEELRPRVFVAENVLGLVSGVAIGHFERILARMRAAGYAVRASNVNAYGLGVPQHRPRVIFVGVREDLGIEPDPIPRLPYSYSLADALPELVGISTRDGRVRSADRPAPAVMTHGRPGTRSELAVLSIGSIEDGPNFKNPKPRPLSKPSATIGASPQTGNGRLPPSAVLFRNGEHVEKRRLTIDELRRICGFPADFVLTGTYAQQWERLGRAVPPPMMRAIATTVADILRRADGNTRSS